MQRKSTKVECICQRCGKSFYAEPNQIARGRGKFCSRPCADQPSSPESLFWARVQKSDGCWLWTGSRFASGYGQLKVGGKRATPQRAHRISWELHFGPIPSRLVVCHSCDTPLCVRPDHLFLGTNADNSADMTSKARQIKGEHHWAAALTEPIVRTIREKHAMGSTIMELARQYSRSHGCISHIVHGRSWKHVS